MNNSQKIAEESICKNWEDRLYDLLWRQGVRERGNSPDKRMLLSEYKKRIAIARKRVEGGQK